jgi:hypothetical protein
MKDSDPWKEKANKICPNLLPSESIQVASQEEEDRRGPITFMR